MSIMAQAMATRTWSREECMKMAAAGVFHPEE